MLRRRLLAAAALVAAALLPAPEAETAQGFLGRAPLFPVPFAGQEEATGGVTSWFRYRNDRTSIQGLRIWVKGLLDEFGDPVIEGATLWMTAPGEFETQQVGSLACTESGSAFFEIVVDFGSDTRLARAQNEAAPARPVIEVGESCPFVDIVAIDSVIAQFQVIEAQ